MARPVAEPLATGLLTDYQPFFARLQPLIPAYSTISTTIRRKIKRTAFKKIARYDVAVTMMMIITVPIDSCLVWLLQWTLVYLRRPVGSAHAAPAAFRVVGYKPGYRARGQGSHGCGELHARRVIPMQHDDAHG